MLNGERLIERGSDLRDLYQENGHDWQNEIACWNDIIIFDNDLIGVEPVAPEQATQISEHGRAAIPPAPLVAGIELRVISETISKLRQGDITRAHRCRGKRACWPSSGHELSIELALMARIVQGLADGDITPAAADAVVSTCFARRDELKSDAAPSNAIREGG